MTVIVVCPVFICDLWSLLHAIEQRNRFEVLCYDLDTQSCKERTCIHDSLWRSWNETLWHCTVGYLVNWFEVKRKETAMEQYNLNTGPKRKTARVSCFCLPASLSVTRLSVCLSVMILLPPLLGNFIARILSEKLRYSNIEKSLKTLWRRKIYI